MIRVWYSQVNTQTVWALQCHTESIIRRRLALVCAALLLLSSLTLTGLLLLSPLHGGYDWNAADPWMLMIVGTGATGCFIHLSLSWSARDACLLLLLASGISTSLELFSMNYGGLFGERYAYTSGLTLRLFGQLPLVIPLTWFILSCIPLALLRPWLQAPSTPQDGRDDRPLTRLLHSRPQQRATRQNGHRLKDVIRFLHTKRRTVLPRYPGMIPRVFLCAILLASMDLHIEPLSVYAGLWRWEQPGPYFGAPLGNLLGWFIVGVAIYTPFFTLVRPNPIRASRQPLRLDRLSVGISALWILGPLILTNNLLDSLLPMWLILPSIGAALLFRSLHEGTIAERWRRQIPIGRQRTLRARE